MSSENKPRTVYKLVRTDKPEDGTDVYVGSASKTLKKRLQKHRGDAKVCNTKLFKRMSEVGIYSWKIVPLLTFTCDQKIIREFEKAWIDVLNTDLNTFSSISNNYMTRCRLTDRDLYYKNLEEKKYYCDVCNKAFGHLCNFKTHLNTKKHKNKNFEQLIEGVHKMIQDGTFSQALENSKEITL